MMRNFLRALALALAGALAATTASAADWPSKPIRFVVPFPPGGTTDLIARLLQDKLQRSLGQTVIVENKAGAQGVIGTAAVANAEPDGYSYVLAFDVYATAPATTPNLPFDPKADLVPVAPLGRSPQVLVVSKDVKAAGLRELWQAQIAKSGELFFGTSATGSYAHLAMAELARQSGMPATHVPYKGGSPMIMATIAQEIALGIGSVGLTSPQIKEGGRLRPIAVMSEQRIPGIDAPTLAEQGFPPVVADSWWALLAPAKTPAPILATMQREIYQALEDPAVLQKYAEQGVIPPEHVSSQAYHDFINGEIDRWSEVAKAQGIAAGG